MHGDGLLHSLGDIIAHTSGQFYLPVIGYSGQDSHVVDSTKVERLLPGIDMPKTFVFRINLKEIVRHELPDQGRGVPRSGKG